MRQGGYMKLRGGNNILLSGRPLGQVVVLPEPAVLYLPLRSRRFRFSALSARSGQEVKPGQVLARDPDNFSVPLLAPRAGVVNLEAVPEHVTLERVSAAPEEPAGLSEDLPHIPKDAGPGGIKRYKLLALGAWQFVSDAHTGRLPSPFGTPQAVIVSTLRLDPYGARGDVQIGKKLASFTRGLEQLQSLLEYQTIYLVVPDVRSEIARQVREAIRGYAWVELVQVPLRYPFDDFAVLSRWLGLKSADDKPVWAMRTEGVLALDRALTLARPCNVRIVSLGGPGVTRPVHLKAMAGYPLAEILSGRVAAGAVRVIDGGVLTGSAIGPGQRGMDAECTGLTVLPEHERREMFSFARLGLDRRSYSRCFLSALRRPFPEPLTTSLRGERRPCISCGFCEEVCPAGIMPHQIHKYLYRGALEPAEQAGLELCVECGLCSYVCPSKIELRSQFVQAKEALRSERAEEVRA